MIVFICSAFTILVCFISICLLRRQKGVLCFFVVLFLAFIVLLFPALYRMYYFWKKPPQVKTIYYAPENREASGKVIYEISDAFRRDYRHLSLDISSKDDELMGCFIDYYLFNGEKYSFRLKSSSPFYRFVVPSNHIKTIKRIEISEIENISKIDMWNTFANP